MKLKVCGMKYNTGEVASLGPDYLGFIFWEPSARYFNQTLPEVSDRIKKVGVFVDAPLDQLIIQLYENDLDLIQLHGEEDPDYCHRLKELVKSVGSRPLEIVKAFSIDEGFNFEILKSYDSVCDYFLFDTKGELPGGTGKAFDWTLLKKNNSTKPFFLSGGIGPGDIDALKDFLNSPEAVNCHAIDVNSRFEIEPGLKNKEELKIFKKKLGL